MVRHLRSKKQRKGLVRELTLPRRIVSTGCHHLCSGSRKRSLRGSKKQRMEHSREKSGWTFPPGGRKRGMSNRAPSQAPALLGTRVLEKGPGDSPRRRRSRNQGRNSEWERGVGRAAPDQKAQNPAKSEGKGWGLRGAGDGCLLRLRPHPSHADKK